MILMVNKQRPNYVCIFPHLLDFHLIKDVGMIPYTMAKYFKYNSSIVTYHNDNYSNMELLENKYFKLNFMKKRFKNPRYDIILYLIRKSRDIDVYARSTEIVLCQQKNFLENYLDTSFYLADYFSS